MRKRMNLEKTIKRLITKVDGHIGSNGAEHLPADLDRPGFMTPNQVKALDSVEKTVVLWEGSVSAVGTVIQLTDNYANYRKIRIMADNLNGNQSVVDYVPLNGWLAINSTHNFNGEPNIFSVFELKLFFQDKTAKINNNQRLDVTVSTNTPVTEGLMQIVKVEGVL